MARGRLDSWLLCATSFCSSRSMPISLGRASRRFSSRSRTRSLARLPMVGGSLLSRLLLRVSTSRLCRYWMSSGTLLSWFVPRFSSTMLVQVPMSRGRDVSWLSFMLSLVRFRALEKIPKGILLIWLCSMLIA
uniref:Uncharacterized protein n=1 Tax=Ixodes ricinus TaxID=34613 RepID=A0A6B0US88_IXORI